VKESDRLQAVAQMVRALGAGAEVTGDDLVIEGVGRPEALRRARTDCGGDHRMAMAAAVAALAAGSGEVGGFAAVDTSYPGFLADLRALGGSADAGRIVAIDGPAGSGKSTVSRAVAERLGVDRLDTGAMYRAVAWAVLERGVDASDPDAVAAVAATARIELDGNAVSIDGTDVTAAIRTPEVNAAVSGVAANPGVRRHLVERQRLWAADHGGGVVEGRDIGTVVFPDADLKIYLDATHEERARRRHEEPADGLARRDEIDSTRATSPLARADDAHLLDTTGRSVEDVVEEVLSWL
jgi:cytidylate kinase